MINNLEIAKALFDPKLRGLIKTVEKDSKTVKEMAVEIEEKPSRLYYPIQKLLKLGLLKVEREVMVNNLKEKYYTSQHLNDEDFQIEGQFAQENREFLLAQVMTYLQTGLDILRSDLEVDPEPEHSNARFGEVKAALSQQEWEELNEEIHELIKAKEQKSSGGSTYSFNVLSYNTEEQ
ncbi:ArsR family transcriptional regulator [Halobacillus salinus]|uniref:ArsR family transcriptional regulator n=1 Tax=Halobacillus salinus TaxID=192814 RepID=A0A4Z0GZA1_9BACI|nr:ArsR family transcriptional regulator [Halobacillus salinus]TGB02014.1 ArsR family transcriptional regulator [Halobacillus salinus]